MDKRITGLDLLRSIAIISVVACHYPTLGFLTALVHHYGQVGVDLFFVLSGFLIGGQLFKLIKEDGRFSLKEFYGRRFLRTLPAYLAVLFLYLLIPALRENAAVLSPWQYFLFLQNLNGVQIFGASWSLCVEEHFYLIFPLLVLLFVRLSKPRLVILSIIAIIAFGVLVRSYIWLSITPAPWQIYIRSIYCPTYCRLDGLTLGVGLAAVNHFRPAHWARLMAYGNKLLAPALGFLLLGAVSSIHRFSLVSGAISYPLFAFGFTFLVAASVAPTCFLGKVRIPGVKQIAVLSYSIYLTHYIAIQIASANLPLTLGLIAVFALALYYAVERPFLNLRDNIYTARRDAPKAVGELLRPGSDLLSPASD